MTPTGEGPMESADLAELAVLLRAERPEPDPGWAATLDRRAAAGFPRGGGSGDGGKRPRDGPAAGSRPPELWRRCSWSSWSSPSSTRVAVAPGETWPRPPRRGRRGRRPRRMCWSSSAPGAPMRGRRQQDRSPACRDSGAIAPGTENRKLDRDAQLSLSAQPDDVRNVTGEVISITRSLGGIVATSQVSETADGASASLQLTIPTRNLDAALDRMTELADVAAEPHGPLAGLGQRDRVASGSGEPIAVRIAEPQDPERPRRARGDHRPRGREPAGPHLPLGERDLQGLCGDADREHHGQHRHPQLAGAERLSFQTLAEGREPVRDERALGHGGRRDPRGRVGERRRQIPGYRGPREEGPSDRHHQRSPRSAALRISRAREAHDRGDREERTDGPRARSRPGSEPEERPGVRRPDLGGERRGGIARRGDHDGEREQPRRECGERDQRRPTTASAAGDEVHEREQPDGQDDRRGERRADRQRHAQADAEPERTLRGRAGRTRRRSGPTRAGGPRARPGRRAAPRRSPRASWRRARTRPRPPRPPPASPSGAPSPDTSRSPRARASPRAGSSARAPCSRRPPTSPPRVRRGPGLRAGRRRAPSFGPPSRTRGRSRRGRWGTRRAPRPRAPRDRRSDAPRAPRARSRGSIRAGPGGRPQPWPRGGAAGARARRRRTPPGPRPGTPPPARTTWGAGRRTP